MIDVDHFREYVIQPALREIGLYSVGAEELLLGTALQESRLQYLKQLGSGPAIGVFQMEPATYNDIWDNFLAYRKTLLDLVTGLRGSIEGPEAMAGNLFYAAAMCRVHYLRAPAALPPAGDLHGQAAYWKRYYNTVLGAGTEEEYMANWERYA